MAFESQLHKPQKLVDDHFLIEILLNYIRQLWVYDLVISYEISYHTRTVLGFFCWKSLNCAGFFCRLVWKWFQAPKIFLKKRKETRQIILNKKTSFFLKTIIDIISNFKKSFKILKNKNLEIRKNEIIVSRFLQLTKFLEFNQFMIVHHFHYQIKRTIYSEIHVPKPKYVIKLKSRL